MLDLVLLREGNSIFIEPLNTWDLSGYKLVSLIEQESTPKVSLSPTMNMYPWQASRAFSLRFDTRSMAPPDVLKKVSWCTEIAGYVVT